MGEQAALAQRDVEMKAMQEQLASGASTSEALKAATDRAEQMAQQLRALEAQLQEQSSLAATAVKVRAHPAGLGEDLMTAHHMVHLRLCHCPSPRRGQSRCELYVATSS